MSSENDYHDSIETLSTFYGVNDTRFLESLDRSLVDKLLSKILEFNKLSSSMNVLEDKLDQLTQEKQGYESTISGLQGTVTVANDEITALSTELDSMKQKAKSIEDGKEEAVRLLNLKLAELDRLQSELQATLGNADDLNSKNTSLNEQLQVVKLENLSLKTDIETKRQSLSFLETQKTWLEQELSTQKREFSEYREKREKEYQEQYTSLAKVTQELESTRTAYDKTLANNNELSTDIRKSKNEIESLRQTLNSEREASKRDKAMQDHLISLLEKQVKEQQVSLDKKFELRTESEKTSENKEDLLEKKVLELTQTLEGTLDHNKALEKELAGYKKGDQVASNIKNKHNNSVENDTRLRTNSAYAQLSDEVSQLRKQLLHEQTEKGQLETQVKALISELEQKIPLFNSLRERAECLEGQLNDASLLLEHTSNDNLEKTEELNRKQQETDSLKERVQSLDTQCTHLAEQVQYLLYNIESLTHYSDSSKRVPQLTRDEMNTVRTVLQQKRDNKSDSHQVISDRLVKFKNVAELQMQNMNLLKAVETLSARAEELENFKKESLASVETVSEAKEAILSLKEYNSMLETKVESLTRELQTYTAQQTTNKQQADDGSSLDIGDMNKGLIKSLRDRLNETVIESRQNIKLLNDEIDKLHETKTKLTLDYETEKSGRKLAEERLGLVQNSLENAERENGQLRSKINNLVKKISDQDSSISSITLNYIECKSKLSVFEYSIQSLKSEKQLSLDAEQLLRKELKEVTEERNNLKLMVTQLQSLQGERESLVRDVQQSCDAEIARLKAALDDSTEKVRSKTREIEKIREDTQTQIKWYKETIGSLEEKIFELNEKLSTKSEELGGLKEQSKEQLQRLEQLKSQIESYKLSGDAAKARNKIVSLEEELGSSKDRLTECYSQIEDYTRQMATSQEHVKELENTLQEVLGQRKELEEANNSLEDKLVQLNAQFEKEKDRFEREKIDLNRKLSVLDFSQKSMEKIKFESEDRVAQLQQDLEHQAGLAIQAEKKYEQEFQRCSEMSEKVSQLRSKLRGYEGEMESMKIKYEHMKTLLEQQRESFSTEKEAYVKKIELVTQRVGDLSSQNKILYDQLDLLGNKDSLSGEDANNRTNKLEVDLINSLRRERDILNTKLSINKQEVANTRQSLATAESELRATKSELANLQTRYSKMKDNEAGEKHDISNQLDLLRESNTTLRNELKEANQNVEKLTLDLKSLQEKYVPLKSELEHLRSSVEEKSKQIQLARDECNRWKGRSDELLQLRVEEDRGSSRKLQDEVDALRGELEEQKDKTKDAESRFQKLKEQARERLDASERANRQLTEELNNIKGSEISSQSVLDEAQKKISHLEGLVKQKEHIGAEKIRTLEQELSSARTRSTELENKLDASMKSSNELANEITRLQNMLQTVQTTDSNLEEKNNSLLESLKQELEDERAKYKLLQQKTEGYIAKLETETYKEGEVAKKTSEEDAESAGEFLPNIEALKKQWLEEYEEHVQQRIKEAEENLKRRIRLPTEEKINRIIEKKKTALQEEYDKNLEEKARDLLKNVSDANLPPTIKDAIEDKLKAKFEKELQEARKKSFEEGKHQASMKLTLLEKKIALLEGQVKHMKQGEKSHASADTSTNTAKCITQSDSDATQSVPSSNGAASPNRGSKSSAFGSPHFPSGKPNLFFQGANTLGSRGAYNPFTSSLKATPVPTPHVSSPSSPKNSHVLRDAQTPTKSLEEQKGDGEQKDDISKRPAETELPGEEVKKPKKTDAEATAVTTDVRPTSSDD